LKVEMFLKTCYAFGVFFQESKEKHLDWWKRQEFYERHLSYYSQESIGGKNASKYQLRFLLFTNKKLQSLIKILEHFLLFEIPQLQ
jgi:hypothetical protein